MLNAIGLDNDGLEHFLDHHLPYLRTLPTAIIGNIAGKTEDEFVEMAARVRAAGQGLAGLELNLSCPNVSGGLDFATDPELTQPHRPPLPRRLPRSAAHRQADAERDRHRA